MQELSPPIRAISQLLVTCAMRARTLDELCPLARRVARLQRAALAEIPAHLTTFRRSLDGPIGTVERVAGNGFQHPPQVFGSMWEVTDLTGDRAAETARRLAMVINNGHVLLSVARKRVEGEEISDASIEHHANDFVAGVLRAVAARDEDVALALIADVVAP